MSTDVTEECIFRWKYNCPHGSNNLSDAGPERVFKIISCSKEHNDQLYSQLQAQLHEDKNLIVRCHRNCVSTYTSKLQIKRHLKRQEKQTKSDGASQPKRHRRCDISEFIFQQHCLFCGLEFNVVKDAKHPQRWRKASLCRTADRGPREKIFKDAVIAKCAQRGDNWASQVLVRVQGAVSDLHAADA